MDTATVALLYYNIMNEYWTKQNSNLQMYEKTTNNAYFIKMPECTNMKISNKNVYPEQM